MRSTHRRFGSIEWSLTVWCVSLAYRAVGGFFSGILLLLAISAVLSAFVRSIRKQYKNHANFSAYLPEIIGLLIYSGIQEKYLYSLSGRAAAGVVAILGLLFSIYYLRKTKSIPPYFMLVMTGFAFIGALLTPRTFHTVFRASCFEAYVTQRFPDRSPEATSIIVANAPDTLRSKPEADELLKRALAADTLRDIPLALSLLDKSIDLNPFNASAYLWRGTIRLLHAELSKESAMEAEKDFSNAIRLDKNGAAAYYYRAHAGSYIGRKSEICEDLERCAKLDSTFRPLVAELQEKNCSLKLTGDFTTK